MSACFLECEDYPDCRCGERDEFRFDWEVLRSEANGLAAALTEIRAMKMRFHPIAGYQFDSDPRKIAAAALEGVYHGGGNEQ